MCDQKSGSIGGGWLGTYAYKGIWRAKPPVRFEATFTDREGNGAFHGTVLDDGDLGEADILGTHKGSSVRFSKTYRKATLAVVTYEGRLSDDGQTITGTWQISGKSQGNGTWDARRLWSAEGGEASLEDVEEAVLGGTRELANIEKVR